ncbi:MAG TPA: hypothetical protein VGE01_06805 [Fimbriimonas sp.]
MHSTTMKRFLLPILGSIAVVLPSILVAQSPAAVSKVPSRANYGVMYFNTNVGSFKILGPGDDKAEGVVSFACNGSVLISGLEGTVQTNLRKEIDNKDLNKQVYFGRGNITISGKYSAIQFFGRDLRAAWNGAGIIRLFGEFDKDLNTGEYWYGGAPSKRYWSSGGMTLTNPEGQRGPGSTSPRVRDGSGPRVRDK